MKPKKNILITGASGFLGSQLTRRLLSDGHIVRAQGRNSKNLNLLPGAIPVRADLTQPNDMRRVLKILETEPVDAVIHLAARCDSWGPQTAFTQINTQVPLQAYQACREYAVPHFIHMSSPSVFSALRHQLNLSEKTPFPKALNHYALSKQQAELKLNSAAKSPTRLTILRPQAIFGPNDPLLLPRLIQASRSRGIPLINGGQHLIDVTPAESVIEAICCCVHSKHWKNSSVYNISNGEPYPFRELIEMVFDQVGEPVNWKKISLPAATATAHLLSTIGKVTRTKHEPPLTPYALSILAYSRTLSIEKAKTELGFCPPASVKETIRNI